ncbi:MAG: ABC transporter [Candidatus Rokuibacteriota bacterium]|nr:MAG: ABC transporter [Candidatus Rokubacteria bacterium]
MALPSLQPRRLGRYRDLALILFKYGRSDLLSRAGMEEILAEELPPSDPGAAAPDELAHDLERLGPTFVKLGQILSTRADLLPDSYLTALARLQDEVAPVPFVDIEKTLREELGVRLSHAFKKLDRTPLAAASLAQVHRAVLRDGRTVAVKVQRPGIRLQAADDLEVLESVASMAERVSATAARYEVGRLVREFRATLLREVDYRIEAENLRALSRNLSGFERVFVPQPVAEYSTSRVLTMDYVTGTKVTALSTAAREAVDSADLADVLFAAYLKQIFVDGFFHADPHPGNLLVTSDGRLAMLDLGMVAHLTPRFQDLLLQLLVAIADGRGDEAAKHALRMGEARPELRADEFERRLRDLVGGQRDTNVSQLATGRMVLQMTRIAAETGLRLPAEAMMLGKTLLSLDEISRRLDPDFRPQAVFRRHVEDIVQRRVIGAMKPESAWTGLLELKDLAQQLPRRANQILERLAEGDVPVRVEGLDQAGFMSACQKIANRITVGLLLAALIVGAALALRIETDFSVFGYPGIAMILFLVAACGALGLIYTILFRDQ